MGTFLYEEFRKKNPFSNEIKEELQERVIETLLDFGECNIEQVKLYGKEIYLCDHKNLMKEGDKYILEYNRFENDIWEPSVMKISTEDFDGVRARAIGSKIGYKQHYIAMAVARVLCECYSAGNYYVCGDIGKNIICKCLAYIGKKYGFELVEKFIEYRTNFNLIKNMEKYNEIYMGVCGKNYYFQRYLDMDYDEWKNHMEKRFRDDLIKVEKGEGLEFIGTSVYLGSLLINAICEEEFADKLKADKEELLVATKNLIQKYFVDVVNINKESRDDFAISIKGFSKCIEAGKYKSYFENISWFSYICDICDKRVFYKTVRNAIKNAKREDFEEIVSEFNNMMEEMIPSKEEVGDLIEYKENWVIYYCLEASDENSDKKILDDIIEISNRPNDIRDNLISDRYINELMLSDFSVGKMTDELDVFLKSIFSEERHAKFLQYVTEAENEGVETNGAKKLLSMAENLYNETRLLFTSELFYRLLDNAHSDEGRKLIHKIDYYLKDLSESNQKEAFLWVLQDDNLRKDYFFDVLN